MARFFEWLGTERSSVVVPMVDDLRDMLRIGEEMFAAACAHLLDNEILEFDLDERDDEVDLREARLRHAALEYLTGHPGRSLPYVLKILGIVQEAERIGDLARSIGETADLAMQSRLGPPVLAVRALRDRVLETFGQTRDSFGQHDASLARQVLDRHDDLKHDVRQTIADLARSDETTTNEAVILTLGARMIGRTSSHLANIASIVVFPYEQIRRSRADDRS